jgi:DNA-binding transcriptional regulator YiaG
MRVEILARGTKCSSCGELVFAYDEQAHNDRATAAALVKRGVRTGVDFKFVRKMADFKATEIAELLGVRPETVSRWERGEVDLPKMAAFAIGELYERPRVTREKLEALAS